MNPFGKRIMLVGLTAAVMAPSPVWSKTVLIEAEDYTTSHNITGEAIEVFPGSGCSGGYFLVGLDYAGEWTEYDVAVTDFGYYALAIKCRGDLNHYYAFRLTFTSAEAGTEESVDFNFTGNGYG